ncbi:hypothetical protein BKA93DRAFT_740567, partial [Sparassis latifolia]
WAGPYIIHKWYQSTSYTLRELDGSILKEHIATSRIKLFFFRDTNQSFYSEFNRNWYDSRKYPDVLNCYGNTLYNTIEKMLLTTGGNLHHILFSWLIKNISSHSNILELSVHCEDEYRPWW